MRKSPGVGVPSVAALDDPFLSIRYSIEKSTLYARKRRLAMDEKARESAFMTALVTEHFVLQSAASTTVSEAGVRASLYVFSLSSALVAMGFTAQSPEVFEPFVATVIPAVFVLGCFTVVRLVDTTVENLRFLRAIARIRRYYRSLAPDGTAFFAPWETSDDDGMEALAAIAVKPGRLTTFFTTASMIATINSLVGGAGITLLAWHVLGREETLPAFLLGAAAASAFLFASIAYQRRRYSAEGAKDRQISASSIG
jgi:hypothetical protein